jgi:putative transposase
MQVHPSGYYDWLCQPEPNRESEDTRMIGVIKQFWLESEDDKPKGMYSGKPHLVIPNTLDRKFDVEHPNQWWVSDMTYIKTYEGFLFEVVVMDLYARNMGSRMSDDLVLSALTMAYWRRKPANKVRLHTDRVRNIRAVHVNHCSKRSTLNPA